MKHYKTIVADPPWAFGDKLPGPKRGAEKHYRVMKQPEIEAYLPSLSVGVTADAWLFLWRVASQQEEALRVVRAWGFVPKAEIVWVKTKACKRCKGKGEVRLPRDVARIKGSPMGRCPSCEWAPGESRELRIGMGRTVRNAHEACIVAKRGSPRRLSASVPSVIFAPRGEHSAKPEIFRDLVERLAPGPYLELFARTRRKGWTCMGDELGGES